MGPGLGRPHEGRRISKRGEKEEPLQQLLACETTRERVKENTLEMIHLFSSLSAASRREIVRRLGLIWLRE